MTFIHDTRDKPGKHDNVDEGLKALGHKVIRTKMYVGDVTLLNDQTICIDLKQNLGEVESNLVHQHRRFRDECIRAQQAGIALVILIEDEKIVDIDQVGGWINPRYARWKMIRRAHDAGKRLSETVPNRPPVNGRALRSMMLTMSERYGVTWCFTTHREAAANVMRILGVAG